MHASAAAQPVPAKGILAMRRITNRAVADGYGASELWVGRVLNGREPPSRRFRAWLADYLDADESELFDSDVALTGAR